MAANPKKPQRRLEKKSAKRKTKKQELVRSSAGGISVTLQRAADMPILDCWRFDSLFDNGIGNVLISRQLPGSQVAVASFLVDAWCLGVKDALCDVLGNSAYRAKFDPSNFPHDIIEMDPPAARKLVEGAVEYSRSLGLSPHSDYQKAKLIFGDIDPEQCFEEFEFGQDGKPYFMAGPYDSASRCRQIIKTLEKRCGAGNFHFTMPLSPGATMIDADAVEEVALLE